MALQRVFKKCNCGCGKNLTTTCLALDTLPEYSSYISAKMRCTNLNNDDFKQYGGRGIEFRFNSFEEFFAEAGHRPAGMTIDRKDKNKHYEVGNVRWATASCWNICLCHTATIGGDMNPQANAAQISQAQFELIGRLSFENALLKGDIAQLQAKIQELMPKPETNPKE
jgi:hypothetical protein